MLWLLGRKGSHGRKFNIPVGAGNNRSLLEYLTDTWEEF